MKASELRIGNYYDHNGLIESVNPNTILHLWESERNWIKPIPLTEEWLIKFGFEIKGEYECNIYKIDYFTILGGQKFYAQFDESGKFHIEIKYVHQLQNLYFAMTGEELTTNINL